MTLQECFEKAAGRFPFRAGRVGRLPLTIEAKLSNGDWVGIEPMNVDSFLMKDNQLKDWELVKPEKPRVFRWEIRWRTKISGGPQIES